MSIGDLKLRLCDVPGIETLTMTGEGGFLVYHLGDQAFVFSPSDSDSFIETHIRAHSGHAEVPDKLPGFPRPPRAGAAAIQPTAPS